MDQKFYILELVGNDLLRGRFGEPGDNDKIAAEVDKTLDGWVKAGKIGGPYALKFDGAASIQVAGVLVHKLGHVFSAIALRDPKMYVEDPDGIDLVIGKGTPYEKTVKARGKMINNRPVPDPVFVVVVAHGNSGFKVGDVIS